MTQKIQIGLPTAICLMVIGAGLVYLNTITSIGYRNPNSPNSPIMPLEHDELNNIVRGDIIYLQGWPFVLREGKAARDIPLNTALEKEFDVQDWAIRPLGIAINAVVFILALTFTAFCVEVVCRRKSAVSVLSDEKASP